MTKICTKCGIEKELDEFGFRNKNKGSRKSRCKKCIKEDKQKDRLENIEKYKRRDKESYNRHKERRKKQKLEYYYDNKEQIKVVHKIYVENNKEKISKKKRENRIKRDKEPRCKCRKLISGAVNRALKSQGSSKHRQSILQYLPYTIEELKHHLESLFEPWMNWENHGQYNENFKTWHIDHIYPQSLLPYDDMSHPNFHKCWELSNLRPLEAMANIRKGKKIENNAQNENNF